jgi:hypothetical protein
MKYLKTGFAIALGFLSLLMLLKGCEFYLATSGQVSGSEFGMQITLVNQLSLLMAWLAVFAGWRLAPARAADRA